MEFEFFADIFFLKICSSGSSINDSCITAIKFSKIVVKNGKFSSDCKNEIY